MRRARVPRIGTHAKRFDRSISASHVDFSSEFPDGMNLTISVAHYAGRLPGKQLGCRPGRQPNCI